MTFQFNMPAYQRRFGEFQGGEYVISTTRQSAITGLLSVGAVIGAVSSGSIASKVSRTGGLVIPWLTDFSLDCE